MIISGLKFEYMCRTTTISSLATTPNTLATLEQCNKTSQNALAIA